MRRAIAAFVAALTVTGCSIGGTDPYSATCSDVQDLAGLDSVAKGLAEEIAPSRNQDQITPRLAALISRECERSGDRNHKPARAVEETARRQLGL
jgi:hypothetical protein